MRSIPHLEEDDRLMPLLSNISKRYLGQDYSCKNNNSGKITADMIDSVSIQSFITNLSYDDILKDLIPISDNFCFLEFLIYHFCNIAFVSTKIMHFVVNTSSFKCYQLNIS